MILVADINYYAEFSGKNKTIVMEIDQETSEGLRLNVIQRLTKEETQVLYRFLKEEFHFD